MIFDTVLMVDWSGGNDRGAKPKQDAIWVCVGRKGQADRPVYLRNRQIAEDWITDFILQERAAGHRVLAGFDFAFGYPKGFGSALTGSDDPLAVWDWFAARVKDAPKTNNRFDLAGSINAQFDGIGPFWGNGLQRDIAHLPRKGRDRTCTLFPEKRAVEQKAKGAFAVWQLSGAGAVGSQVIMGLPMLARLRHRFNGRAWPFEPLDTDFALIEIWPSLIADIIADTQPTDQIKDAHQVQVLAQTVSGMPAADVQAMLDIPCNKEGWIFGVGSEDKLRAAAQASDAPPPLRNDCFAMPQGAYWTPVADALNHLRRNLSPVTRLESCPIAQAAGRFLGADITASRSHPPTPNAAVDGYGFAGPAPKGIQHLPLVDGRAAAGAPYQGNVPQGHAIRILTGASLPDGVDTVVLQEDVTASATAIRFHGPLKQGANARKAGEDMQAGQRIIAAKRRLTPADLGTAIAAGIGTVRAHKPLKVGILSTGDELRPPGSTATDDQIFDANRPMLSALAAAWGYTVVDLGQALDDADKTRAILDQAADACDVILTSGGASGGDEDHMSRLLQDQGALALWRVAIKPGRPLVMGQWRGVPVFGLPGNPVAAFVCALIFAHPALRVLAGGEWATPQAFPMPAAFTKSKKSGRTEYLRARIEEGQVTIFPSEGSGRVSGLSWATGLVVLDDPAQTVTPGDMVQYIPFSSFDL